ADTLGRFLCVKLSHAPVVEQFSAPHSVAKMSFPIVGGVHVGHGRGDAAAMPPSAITVWALPRSDLQITPTEAPWASASSEARNPAPPAPMTRTSCSRVS